MAPRATARKKVVAKGEFEVLSIGDLTPDPSNARIHNPRNVGMIEDALKTVGAARSIVIDENGVVLAGNATMEAAAAAGFEHVLVVPADGKTLIAVQRGNLDAKQKAQLAVFDNRASELATGWNGQVLQSLAANLGVDMAPFFRKQELARIIDESAPDPELQGKRLAKKWKVARGQVWGIPSAKEPGAVHRIVIGDSGDPAVAERALEGGAFDALFTSPPYNVSIQYSGHDDHQKDEQYADFLERTARVWFERLRPGRAWIWNIGVSPKTRPFRQAIMLEDLGLTFVRQYVWKKVGVPVPSWHHTADKPEARKATSNYVHELVLIYSKLTSDYVHEILLVYGKGELERGPAVQVDSFLENDVFEINQSQATRDIPEGDQRTGSSNLATRSMKAHPAAFPVQLPRGFLQYFTARGETVVDPFMGSGTTLLACEELGRVGVGIEIDPQYAAVALERATLRGLAPVLLEAAPARATRQVAKSTVRAKTPAKTTPKVRARTSRPARAKAARS